MKQDSSASSRARVSADNVLFTTLFDFLDFHAIGENFSFPHKNITKPSWDAPFLRFANEASLKHVMYRLSRFPKPGNCNTTSELFSFLIFLFPIFKSLIIASFMDVLTSHAW